jgi:hypothetical protein
MAYSNTQQDFYQTPMGTMVTEPISLWDTSTHCAYCSEQYAYCGCENDEIPEPVDVFAICAVCDYAVSGLFYLNGDSTGRCAGCHNANR